jgi:hypothetical protein
MLGLKQQLRKLKIAKYREIISTSSQLSPLQASKSMSIFQQAIDSTNNRKEAFIMVSIGQ